MNNKNSLEYYKELVISYLNSSSSKDEEQELLDWLKRDIANKKYFDECREIWLSAKLEKAQREFSSEEAFERFQTNIGQCSNVIINECSADKEKNTFLLKRISLSILKIAAVLLLTFLCGFFAFSLIHKRNSSGLTYQEITVPSGSKTKLRLPDGTQVWLNAESKLVYASNYNQTKREVRLVGEGYFKVAHDDKRPFLVKTSKITIRALGTEFNVKCYADEGSIEATLVKGLVKVEVNKDEAKGDEDELYLKPNQRLTYIKRDGKLYLESEDLQLNNDQKAQDKKTATEQIRQEQMFIKAIDPQPLIAWKEDKLIFTGEKFEAIKLKLERWYGVSIQIQDEEILSYRFKGSFEKETLEQALEALKLAAYFKYSIYKDQVIITK